MSIKPGQAFHAAHNADIASGFGKIAGLLEQAKRT